jgi:hypothetical protein
MPDRNSRRDKLAHPETAVQGSSSLPDCGDQPQLHLQSRKRKLPGISDAFAPKPQSFRD